MGSKVVIFGLDQAGKTSILNILGQEYNLMDNLKPTVGINRKILNILGHSIINFDLGGQERFRQDYLSDRKVFNQTDSLFFVIDALSATRYEEALHYYSQVLKVFDELDSKPKITVCIHKIDPNLRNNEDTPEIINEIQELVLSESKGFEVTFYVTSIYDRRSIVEAFSKTLQGIVEPLKPFKPILESLVGYLKLDGAILFDENFMIVADHCRSDEFERQLLESVYNSVFYMRQMNPTLAGNFIVNFEIILDSKSPGKRFNFLELKYGGQNLYLLTMGTEKFYGQTLKSKFESITKLHEKQNYFKES